MKILVELTEDQAFYLLSLVAQDKESMTRPHPLVQTTDLRKAIAFNIRIFKKIRDQLNSK